VRTCKPLFLTLFIVQLVYSNEKIKFESPDSMLIKQTLDSLLFAQDLMALQYEILHYNNEFKEIINNTTPKILRTVTKNKHPILMKGEFANAVIGYETIGFDELKRRAKFLSDNNEIFHYFCIYFF